MSTLSRHHQWAGDASLGLVGYRQAVGGAISAPPRYASPQLPTTSDGYQPRLRLVGNEPSESEPQLEYEASPWTLKQKFVRAVWMLAGRPVFRATFHNWYGIRRWILRAFGARIGRGVRVRPSAKIEIPWNLTMEDGSSIGDGAIIYSLGPITIGRGAIVSQYAHLCAGTHDYESRSFKLLKTPITIGAEAWIAAEAFVGPGVEVGHRAVLGARSCAYKLLEESTVYAGNPAKPIRLRSITR